MIIYFKNRKLEKICNEGRAMKKKYGEKMSNKLQQRLFELNSASSLADISYLPPPRLHELTGNRSGQFSVDLIHPFRLIFISANSPVPLAESGGIDKKRVTEIEIIDIIDTH